MTDSHPSSIDLKAKKQVVVLFVVPDKLVHEFKEQDIVNNGEIVTGGIWPTRVSQWVMGLGDEVWDAKTVSFPEEELKEDALLIGKKDEVRHSTKPQITIGDNLGTIPDSLTFSHHLF
ncbi:hypothetical protein H0H81_006877 [Sphagnurus paluster]|uniref:Uncharacterized protein n=1 Tax=Sphagnurus paluster TaxID=117069 RepID=A0A9P7GMC6_9AGAR|nr:hypothetical protein H0H81_006877 [Sphagnurus paluster]